MNSVDPISEVENRYRPLWPGYLASYAEKVLGTDVIEFRFLKGEFETELDRFRPDVVAISSVSQNFNYAVHYARIAKERGLAVLVGGMHISNLPECLTDSMDVACIGEAEETFAELMGLFLEHGSFPKSELHKVKGIVYRQDDAPRKRGQPALKILSAGESANGLHMTPARPLMEMADIPNPKRSLIGYQKHDYMFTSRGCPFKCTFCASTRYWAKTRFAPTEYVIEEIEQLVSHGVETISFYDDIFIAKKSRFHEVSDAIVAAGLHRKARFTCSIRAQMVNPEAVAYLKQMNVVSVGLGLESGNDRILDELKGKITVEHGYRAIDLLKDAGIQVNGSFIIGNPTETEDEIMDTYNFIRKSRLDFFDVYLLTPLPGTNTWHLAESRNLVSNQMDWTLLNVNFEVHPENAIIMSDTLDRATLLRLYRRFRRLRMLRIAMALPFSPWLRDLPRMGSRMLAEKMKRYRRGMAGRTAAMP